jgi:large subunit ribosomal protein L13
MQKIERKKHTIDATGQAAGRIATQVARLLLGKNKPGFAPNLDAGDYVEVMNAGKIKFTGRKLVQKDYYGHTQYPGGLSREPMKILFEKNPGTVIERAVYGMLPKNRLRDNMIKRLTIKS